MIAEHSIKFTFAKSAQNFKKNILYYNINTFCVIFIIIATTKICSCVVKITGGVQSPATTLVHHYCRKFVTTVVYTSICPFSAMLNSYKFIATHTECFNPVG